MSKLKSVSLYDVYKLEGEDKARAIKALIDMYEAVNILGDTYIGFADDKQNNKQLQEEMEMYIADKRKDEPEFTMTLCAYTFLRFGVTIEAKLEELNNNIKSKLNEEETIG
jgi:hypothetical protein